MKPIPTSETQGHFGVLVSKRDITLRALAVIGPHSQRVWWIEVRSAESIDHLFLLGVAP